MSGKRRAPRERDGRRDPDRAEVRRGRQQRNAEKRQAKPKRELPMAEELTERDLPRLLAAAERQMERNRRRHGVIRDIGQLLVRLSEQWSAIPDQAGKWRDNARGMVPNMHYGE